MYDTNRFIHAAEPCAYREAFAEDMRRCDNALGMGGLMGINAECWLDVLFTTTRKTSTNNRKTI